MTVSVFLVNSEFLILHYSLFIDKSCTTCLFISKSFKELFFMAFFRKADAKVRLIFELPKLFRSFFKKFFLKRKSKFLNLCQHFNSSAFLSRKRMQNYCFTTYLPNIVAYFFALFCKFSAKSLICRTVGGSSF